MDERQNLTNYHAADRSRRWRLLPAGSMAMVPWSARFDEPIPVPKGRPVVTLEAGNHIKKLQKAEYEAPEWQAAMEALIPGRDAQRPDVASRIARMQALNGHAPKPTPGPRRKIVRPTHVDR
jgi:hypothetical protein